MSHDHVSVRNDQVVLVDIESHDVVEVVMMVVETRAG